MPGRRIVLIVIALLCLSRWAWAAPDKVRVGLSPALSSAGIFIAQEQGYFRAAGLDVELVEFPGSGPELLPALAAGQLDVAAGNVSAKMYNAMAQGIQIRIVADKGQNSPGCGYLAIVVRSGLPEVRSAADLKGRNVALTGPGVSQEIVLDRYLVLRPVSSSLPPDLAIC